MTRASSRLTCSPELTSLLRVVARTTSPARLAGSTTQAHVEADTPAEDLKEFLHELQGHQTEIRALFGALQGEATDLSDEQLEAIAAGRIDLRTMVLTLAGTISIATSDGSLLLGTTAGLVGLSQAPPVQAALQVAIPLQQPAWMQPSLSIIKEFEGLELEAYIDAVGIATIGWGTTVYPDGTPVKMGETVTAKSAETLLVQALLRDYAPGMFRALPMATSFTPQQQAALISFTYNVGIKALEDSTLRKRLISGEIASTVISEELPRWRYGDNGRSLEGLVRRRQAEVDLFLNKSAT